MKKKLAHSCWSQKTNCVIYLDFITACIQLHQALVIFIEILVEGMTNLIIIKPTFLLYNTVQNQLKY